MITMKLFCIIFIICCGCAAPLPHGIPNLRQVDYTIYRGGQPNDMAAWHYLHDVLGITNVVKLNTESEGSDADAVLLDMKLTACPISLQEQIFGKVNASNVWRAVDAIVPYTYVHCEHGQDRTGLIIACWRIEHGATKPAAQSEMLRMGFHWNLLPGLRYFWIGIPE